MNCKSGQVFLCLRENLATSMFKQRLLEILVPDFPGEIGKSRKAPVAERTHAIKQRAKSWIWGSPSFCTLQALLKNSLDSRDLLLYSLIGFADPEQAVFEFRRAIKGSQAVVGERLPQPGQKGLGESFPTGVEHAKVGKEVGLGTGSFSPA